ncbi:cytochrome c1 heme lyase CYT2 [Sugiyamaella lignohabitans]|uniref:Holocytochrome c-type synthase n=1 Tax=Sugiyamaella lignohabitans TaxID=796027 RepID=A0A167DY66_9ASCO|nr:cytochrome c1 heme lyase CYT2 [Sugiyamaella lignohabitans]ANB13434.1 cytochrome c1 heme lyase CYT2 [Sugiyamaella lignohabitans]
MNGEDKCPVDHASRQAWLDQAKAAGSAANAKLNLTTHDNPGSDTKTEAVCPVDHSARNALLNASKISSTSVSSKTPDACSSDRLDSYSETAATTNGGLSQDREVSSIPRAGTGKNWVYPSQQQFFNAMKRKNFDPNAKDMETIIPIHNAVNERAWMEILKWEEGQGSEACGGPQLVRFEGDASKLTPTARWNMMFGIAKPFDRHDWMIDRCGTKVEYVIDFYTGKPNPLIPEMPSFYLDVRPKLNSVEGVRMRIAKFFGF